MNTKITLRPIGDLHPRPNNPRKHSKKQLEKIAKSIRRFGFTNPIITDDDGSILAGHGRYEAARLLGLTEVPTILLSGMSEADKTAYVIADNQLGSLSKWAPDLLKVELSYLSELEEFDLTATAFEIPEIDAYLYPKEEAKTLERDDQIPPVQELAITQIGDVWQIGRHRLICADATSTETYKKLMKDTTAKMIFADGPYNVKIKGHVSGLGKTQHREFAMASGEMDAFEFTSFMTRVWSNLAKWSIDGSIHYQCGDWRHLREMLDAGEHSYTELKNVCVWSKSNGGMGSFYRSAHELVFVFKSGKAAHQNNIDLGKHGRFRTNVWQYAGANSFGATRDDDLAMHPTVKPVALVMDAILDCSSPNEIVLDPFAGSGTTLVASQRTKRIGYGIEIDPLYCDVIIRRMQKRFKLQATLADDGRSFDEVAQERTAQSGEIAA